MTVSNSWQDAYRRLEEFVAARPDIIITASRVSLPDDARDEFYRRFDTVRDAFVQEHAAALPAEAAALVESYGQVEKEILTRLGLEGVAMPTSLATFLHDPPKGLASALFDGLFELVQGKVDLATFDRQARAKLEATTTELGRVGYPYWVSLSLLKLLEPDQVFQVGLDSESRPVPQAAKEIPFGHPVPHPVLRLPEFIVHSRRIDRYVALKLELASEIASYHTDNRGERKRAMRTLGQTFSSLGPRLLLLYRLTGLDAIPIVADIKLPQVSSPDLTLECSGQGSPDWDVLQSRSTLLQPQLGTYVVAREPKTETDLLPPRENLRRLTVGLDAAKLEPIFQSLATPSTA